MTDDDQAIRERAYFIWEREVCPSGKALEHWLRGEQETKFMKEFMGLGVGNLAATTAAIEFYRANYDIVVHRLAPSRGPKEFLGQKPQVCRFCSKTSPEVTFRKDAHAISELTGNGTLLSYYECDDCNDRFSAFEDDLGKLTLIERIAGQVLGKGGVPSAKTGQKRSRIDMGAAGFETQQFEGDPIVDLDSEAQTVTITVSPQSYRPLGVYKALVKMALTLMDGSDLANVTHALKWLRAKDLTTDQVDDGVKYTCLRTFTPGPAPYAITRAVLFRRKRLDVPGPAFIFLIAFGNISFQIVVPAPQVDYHLAGSNVNLQFVPLFAFQAQDRVRGPTQFMIVDLSSPIPVKSPSSAIFHYDSYTKTK